MRRFRFENLRFSPDDGRLEQQDGAVGQTLRPQVATLLAFMLEQPGEVLPRERLCEAVWGKDAVVDFESGLAALIRELRQALAAVGASETLIETVPRRGYRFNGEVRKASAGRLPRRIPILAAAATMAVVALFGLGYWLLGDDEFVSTGDFRLAILPFESYQPVEAMPEHAGLLMADSLLAALLVQPTEGLDLIGRTSLRPYVDRNDVAAAVAADLGVELLIEGAVSGEADGGWRAEVRLLAVPAGQVLWSTTVEDASGASLDVHAVADRMAEALVSAWPRLRADLSG